MEIFNKIRNWAASRGIYTYGDIKTQTIKLGEEYGELCQALINEDDAKITDAIGDIVIVLTSIAHFHGCNIEQCILLAYQQIKDRTGQMKNNSFIKDIK